MCKIRKSVHLKFHMHRSIICVTKVYSILYVSLWDSTIVTTLLYALQWVWTQNGGFQTRACNGYRCLNWVIFLTETVSKSGNELQSNVSMWSNHLDTIYSDFLSIIGNLCIWDNLLSYSICSVHSKIKYKNRP